MMPSNNEYQRIQQKKLDRVKSNITVKYATVIALTLDGDPIIQFDGEKLPSGKLYRFLKSYSPAKGDKVQLINNVIQGGWNPRVNL